MRATKLRRRKRTDMEKKEGKGRKRLMEDLKKKRI